MSTGCAIAVRPLFCEANGRLLVDETSYLSDVTISLRSCDTVVHFICVRECLPGIEDDKYQITFVVVDEGRNATFKKMISIYS